MRSNDPYWSFRQQRRPGLRHAGYGLAAALAFGLMTGGPAWSQTPTVHPTKGQSDNVFAARWPSSTLPGADSVAVRTIAYSSILASTSLFARQAQRPPQAESTVRPRPKTEIMPFAHAPFPYRGLVPGTDRPFLDVDSDGKKGHRTARGAVLWEHETFNDSRVLLHIPPGFDINRPAVMVVFFHGHGAELTRDVLHRQNVPAQITLSGTNAVLVAPQFAVDTADSSAGRFWQPGGFARFVNEAAEKLASLNGNPATTKQFAKMPVIIVAYSGGYRPAAWSIRNGGLGARLHGLVLLDGLYGEIDSFADWIKNSKSKFFVSAYTSSTRRQNLALANILSEKNVPVSAGIGRHLWNGGVALLATDSDVSHQDFVTQAWTENPIADILAHLN